MSELRPTTIQTERRNGAVILRVSGELDALCAPDLEKLLSDQITAGVRACIVDLSQTTFIDSMGLGRLIQGQRAGKEAGCYFAVCGARGMIAQLMTVTQLSRVLPTFETAEAALQAFESAARA
ncbi:MAG: STAS domain-containing protein [Chloroflexi bacterium]|nr:STAS domain-containing protein [Chloroflexota bacterium]